MDLEQMIKEGLECCNMETGEYFQVTGVIQESGKPVLTIEPAEV